jgi:hypothetical protein
MHLGQEGLKIDLTARSQSKEAVGFLAPFQGMAGAIEEPTAGFRNRLGAPEGLLAAIQAGVQLAQGALAAGVHQNHQVIDLPTSSGPPSRMICSSKTGPCSMPVFSSRFRTHRAAWD